MKIISFFLCALFICSFGDTQASSSLEHAGIYYLEVIEVPEKTAVVRIKNQDEKQNLETTNFDDFGNLIRIPVILTANQDYQFGDHVLHENDKITVCYHFSGYKSIRDLNKQTPMQLPEEFIAMTEWQAVIRFANALMGQEKFNINDSVENVSAFMNDSVREYRKKQYQGMWIETFFWRKKS